MTRRYASPEQIRGLAITTATDIYALGVVLYELMTGRHPYPIEDLTDLELEHAICRNEPTKPDRSLTQTNRNDQSTRRALAERIFEKKFDELSAGQRGELYAVVRACMLVAHITTI